VDLKHAVLHVRRAVTHVDGADVIGAPKSAAGVRDVAIPPHLIGALTEHLRHQVPVSADALLFTSRSGGHLRSASVMHEAFHDARRAAGRPDLRFHDVRHTGGDASGCDPGDAVRTEATARPFHPGGRDALPARDRRPGQGHCGSPVRVHAANVITLRPMRKTS
jgi:integrase